MTLKWQHAKDPHLLHTLPMCSGKFMFRSVVCLTVWLLKDMSAVGVWTELEGRCQRGLTSVPQMWGSVSKKQNMAALPSNVWIALLWLHIESQFYSVSLRNKLFALTFNFGRRFAHEKEQKPQIGALAVLFVSICNGSLIPSTFTFIFLWKQISRMHPKADFNRVPPKPKMLRSKSLSTFETIKRPCE